MGSEAGNVSVLRNLAHDLLTQEENSSFRETLRDYRKSSSLTTLVTQLTKIITSTEKLMLLVELSAILPAHLRRDFHKLCCLHFPKYESFLTYFTPTSVGERSRVITQDPTGQFQVVSTRFDRNLHLSLQNAKPDQRSLPGESGIDVSSDLDDISRHGDGGQSDLSSTWKIRSTRSNSMSSYAGPTRQTTSPTPTDTDGNSGKNSWRHSPSSLSIGDNGIRNRARSLRILSGSLPTVLAPKDEEEHRTDNKIRMMLKRREDGSLGIGIKGGKEYRSPIEVYLVEPGSQAELQGLRVGDRILDVNGTDFGSITHAEAVMMMRNAWNIIMIVHRPSSNSRGNSRANDRGTWPDSYEELEVVLYPGKKGKLGCGVYRDDYGNLVVRSVDKNSAASKAGLCQNDRFMEIDGIKVHSLTDKQIATLTNVKRIRIKICRVTKKVRPEVESPRFEFDNIMMPSVTLDLSPLGLGDDEIIPFSSSTPRTAMRSRSEERRPIESVHRYPPRERSSSEIRPQAARDKLDGAVIEHQVEVEVHHTLDTSTFDTPPEPPSNPPPQLIITRSHESDQSFQSSRNTQSYDESFANRNHYHPQQQLHHYHHHHHHQSPPQQRMYRPRVMTSSGGVTSPKPQHRSAHQSRALGRYMPNNSQSALPSRLAMMYTPAPSNQEKERSRSKKKSGVNGSSTSSKMKQLRHRSQSPSVNCGNSAHPHRDREFLRAIQNSVERRQRAHRLSIYQLPDQDDDIWNML